MLDFRISPKNNLEWTWKKKNCSVQASTVFFFNTHFFMSFRLTSKTIKLADIKLEKINVA